ncbi:MAG: PfaD family polyunsaturated fatty acid/polyketide biosynthesis protein [Desulfobacterales bacterium]|jgi:PfaD family protein|nr:PfaD family polyunsaturated fatty acid/polyketide biosynthesis protein [Desulfobacterales bacterium]
MVQFHGAQPTLLGWWKSADKENGDAPCGETTIHDAALRITHPMFLVDVKGKPAVFQQGCAVIGKMQDASGFPLLGYAPALWPENFGDAIFKSEHQLKYPYVAGAMANAITSVNMVAAMGKAGMIGFFGAGGLTIDEIEAAVVDVQAQLNGHPYGFNLIHSPFDPELEKATVALYLRKGVRRVSAAAYMDLTLPLVHYRLRGIHRDPQGRIICPNKVVAKVSRVEVARKFFSPPPGKLVDQLLSEKLITREEADLSQFIPVAHDLTAEADSGGHTDNRAAIALLPTMLALRNELQARYGYSRPLCVGLAGGIATPHSTAAAFAMGAAYVLTGTVNQACVESGTSDTVRHLLAEAGQADVAMTPSADMFEMGVKVQVLKRGTMFPLRAAKLYEIYNACESLDHIPASQRAMLEKTCFHKSIEAEWEQTRAFFLKRDPGQIPLAEQDPKHKMALVFRSYLGQSCRWATSGNSARQMDYQIWCGPAIGAFNEWTKGSFLERPENRNVVTVAKNLLVGAAMITRLNWLSNQGIHLQPEETNFTPLPLETLNGLLTELRD